MNVLRPIICVSTPALLSSCGNQQSTFILQTNLRNSFRFSRNLHPCTASVLLSNRPIRMQNVNKYSSSAILENNTKGIFNKMFAKLSNSKSVSLICLRFECPAGKFSFQRLRASSILLYENVSDRINYYQFFEEFGMPDTFNSWFLVTELHIWLLLMRVMGEGSESGQDGRFLRNCIVEALWVDVQTRAKKLSADNPSASRAQVAILAEQFQATLINYDEGLMSDDQILASALWRRFFDMKCEDYTKLEKLVKYVRCNSQKLDVMTREQLLTKPNIEWEPLD